MVNLSLFEEEQLFHRRMMMPGPPVEQPIGRIRIGEVTTDLTYKTPSEKQKRSKFEAGARATEHLARLRPISRIPFFRPYFYLLGGLTYGLILLDPLDRLE